MKRRYRAEIIFAKSLAIVLAALGASAVAVGVNGWLQYEAPKHADLGLAIALAVAFESSNTGYVNLLMSGFAGMVAGTMLYLLACLLRSSDDRLAATGDKQ